MSGRLKVMTVVGTRPEIIRLSRIIAALEEHTNHVLVHTGQNYDYELNEIFFEDLGLRRPDHFLNVDTSSLGAVLGDVLRGTELLSKAGYTPFEGYRTNGGVSKVYLRGELQVDGGKVVGGKRGEYLKRGKCAL